jgi:peptidoglycan/LPS O-acetylase OafA/YrhL
MTAVSSRNNFNLLRLLFAVSVFVTHLYELSGITALKVVPLTISSFFFVTSGGAVQGFFVISGFLIFMSYERAKNLRQYVEKRVRRLYPGYAVNIIITTFLLGFVSTLGFWHYIVHPETGRFIVFNMIFKNFTQSTLPGVFVDHRFTAVNGVLWTLQIEAIFYAVVPLIAEVSRKVGRIPVFVGLYVLSTLYVMHFVAIGDDTTARMFPGQLTFFSTGGLLYYYFSFFRKNRLAFLFGALAIYAFHLFCFPVPYLLPLVRAIIVVFCACCIPFLGDAARFGDFSYAIYIYHFPIIQTLLMLNVWTPVSLFFTACITVAGAAFASWNVVERRFLHRSSLYLRQTTPSLSMEPSPP